MKKQRYWLLAALAFGLAWMPHLAEAGDTIQRLITGDSAGHDWFGNSVSVSGSTAVVGAPRDDDNGTDSGSAYVFVLSDGTWSLQAKLLADDGQAQDQFGRQVSISGDTVVVSSQYGTENKGAAYVFVRSGSSWSQQQKLLADDGQSYDQFGGSVSISGDTAVIGAWLNDDKGSAYVFVRSGSSWSQQAKLLAGDGSVDDGFGIAVSVDGDTAVIGAWMNDENGSNAGSAYVFVRSGSSWSQQAKLLAGDGQPDDQFGNSVSISRQQRGNWSAWRRGQRHFLWISVCFLQNR